MKINKTIVLVALAGVVSILAFFAFAGESMAQVTNTNDNYLENNNNSGGSNEDNSCDSQCEYPELVVNCYVSSTRGEVGDVIGWSVGARGGNGYYSFRWTGTDGLSSNYQTITKKYTTAGDKFGQVEVTSYGETVTKTCKVVIEGEREDNDKDLGGYCVGKPSRPEEGEKVTWTAYPEGGGGDYEYEWSGTDGLDGDDKSISKRYDDEGTKTAKVKITSDGESVTRTCSVRVEEEDEDNDDLEAYCVGTVDGNNRVRWTVYPDGGDNDYEYEWDGTDNLSGDDKSITKTYSNGGRKEAEVEVESDGDRVTARCSVNINETTTVYVPPTTPTGGIYLSSIPATGISPTMKTSLFVAGLFMWSAFLAYLYIARKNEKMKEEAILSSLER